jgi:serine/threonine protein kinase
MQENKVEERGLCLQDFKIIRPLGKGAFGQVLLAKKKSTSGNSPSEEVFAIKRVRNKFVSAVEKEVLFRAVGHPFLVQLVSYFQTNEAFCYVMEYYEGGTLLSMMSRLQRFHEHFARFYAAEIILAVNFLHKCGIVHRDIKPDNILLDRDGHCRLADFGLSKIGIFKGMCTEGVCGTVKYMAPEILRRCPYGPEVDWWSV